MKRPLARVLAVAVIALAIDVQAKSVDAMPAPATAAPIVAPTVGGSGWTRSAIAKLDADLDAILAASPTIHGAHVGIRAIDTRTNAVLFSRNGDDEFQPASTLKLLVGSAALEKLGPAFRFRTTMGIFVDDAKMAALVLHGVGDPTLATADLVAGIATIPPADRLTLASVAIDATAFDEKPYPDGWTWDDFAQDYAPHLSAVTVDENTVTLRVTPGATVGAAAEVSVVDPRTVTHVVRRCNAFVGRFVRVVSGATTGANGSDDTIDVTRNRGGCPQVVGSIPLGAAAETVATAVASPVFAASETLAALLGLASPTRARDGMPPEEFESLDDFVRFRSSEATNERIVWTHDSLPLASLLGPRFWLPSDNLFGELLLEQLGLATVGKPGTTAKGIVTEKQWLQSIGVDPATVTLADGSGLSQYDRITPRDLIAILQHDWNGPNRQLVLDSLPVGGVRGTIEGIAGSPAAGRVFAKTGSMMHVRGLAGYLATMRHGAVTFAFNVDDWNGAYPDLAAVRAAVLARIVTD